MQPILHITKRAAWERAQAEGSYCSASLSSEGFLHCMTEGQVAWVAEKFFKGQPDLVLLHIDEAKLAAPLRYESPPGKEERFPHIYGPLNLDAVVKVEPFEPSTP
jgi:uncharacterized protein (DUF952 family)